MKPTKLFILATLLSALAFSTTVLSQSAGISGERCYARIKRATQVLTLNPNSVGSFPTLDVKGQSQIAIQVVYPSGQANEKVVLTVMEGGIFGNGLAKQDVTLDSLKTATFSFATGSGRGLYRVLVIKGSDYKILEFWVGEKLPVATE